ncbi:MAG: ATP-grasp domain-containing protein [Candidatus Hodarchaeota archaeon]
MRTHSVDVIVLDGNQRPALAITRLLGRKGIKVAVGEEVLSSLSSCSRYCSYRFSYPSPYVNPEAFIEKIQKISARNHGATLLPITDVTLSEVLRNKALLSNYVKIPFVDYNKYTNASDKLRLFRLALDLNIPIPKTLFYCNSKELGNLISEAHDLGFPVVLKPATSRIRTARRWINAQVHYANNSKELKEILNKEPFRNHPFMIQERIEGPGVGIFLLMDEGNVLARFAHRRIREKPPSGGVSVLCESIRPPWEALDAATRLLKELLWSGVAMVEFKWDVRDNIPMLIEVNARFWGSLQLAISAGVDFPYLLYSLSKGEKINGPKRYVCGIKSRWELGDLDHLVIRLRNSDPNLILADDAESKRKAIRNFIIDFFRPSIQNEVFRPDDPFPFLFEIIQYLRNIAESKLHGCFTRVYPD